MNMRRKPIPSPSRTARPPDPRDRILRAAIGEFACKGLAGARVDEIAARAKINKRMLYHYFGNKEALYLAVLEAVYADLLRAEGTLDLDHSEPVEGIRRLVSFLWTYYLAHPEFISLVNNENMLGAVHLRRSKSIREMHSSLVSSLDGLLERGRAQGAFRADVDAVQLYISTAALAYFYLSNNHTLSTIFGRNLMATRAKVHRVAHITDMVLSYLAAA
jgi:AcrR family transcriptional regulator